MTYTPPPPGSVPTPGWLTRLWSAILARTRIVGGPGIQVRDMPDGGKVVSLDDPRLSRFEALITVAPTFAPTAPASCKYTVVAIGRPQLTLTNVLPKLGRPTQNDEWMLWPAKVGDPCTIVRTWDAAGNSTDALWIGTEAIAAKPC